MLMRSMMAAISAAVAMGAANAVANTWYVSPEGGGNGSDREHPTDAQTAFTALNASKESDNEIWIDVYALIELLQGHRSSLRRTEDGWERVYPYVDLDREPLPTQEPA